MRREFDELSKALASGAGRRQALLALASAAVGGMLGFWPGRTAEFGFNPHLDLCERYCKLIFPTSKEEQHECIKDARRERGRCYSPGPGMVCCGGRACRPSDCVVNGTLLTCVVNGTAVRL